MMSELDRRMTNRTIATPIATLPDLRRVTPWLWVICERCQHRAPTARHHGSFGGVLTRQARCCAARRAAANVAVRVQSFSCRDGVDWTRRCVLANSLTGRDLHCLPSLLGDLGLLILCHLSNAFVTVRDVDELSFDKWIGYTLRKPTRVVCSPSP